jgi:diguanylate cyclase (GGDEF)-like protein/PAS domain S-box-containing protein
VGSRRLGRRRPPGSDREWLVSVLDRLPYLVFVKDARDLRLVYLNEKAQELLGRDRSELVGKTDHDLFPAEQADFFARMDRAVLAGGQMVEIPSEQIETSNGPRVVHVKKVPLFDEQGRPAYLVGVAEDITDLRRQAGTDDLTGLPNRRELAAQLDRVLARRPLAAASEQQHGLLLLDLDGFKEVNDGLGHASGDLLLQRLARRLKECVRAGDLVARLGGDEFAILIQHASDLEDLERTGSRLLAEVQRPVDLGGFEVQVSASIGVVPFTDGANEQLLGDADLAMYEAKAHGRNQSVVFHPQLRQRVEHRTALQADLRQAVAHGALDLWHQPIVNLTNGAWVGAESLSRWEHPTRGHVPAAEFIELAEESGMIGKIGSCVLAKALPRLRAWKSILPDDNPFCLGVNMSARELADPHLVDRVLNGCQEIGIPTDALVLELTESTLMGPSGKEHARLAELRRAGVRIAIDDFGTGYSSLSYLARLPADIIKLDRSFVAALGAGRREEAVIRATASLARDLDLILVAEGVETGDQVSRLLDLGCELGQGYHFQPPMPALEFETKILTLGLNSRVAI